MSDRPTGNVAAELSAAAAVHRARVLELLAAAGVEILPRAWDAQIRAVVGKHPAAAAEWKLACDLWWRLALHRTERIAHQEAMRFLYSAPGRYTLDDLEQGARIGLYRAAQGWRPGQASSWATYARRGARMGVQACLRDGATEAVQIPKHLRPRMWELRRELDLQQQRGEQRDLYAAARRMGLGRREMEDLWAAHNSTSMDAKLLDDPDGGSLHDVLGVPGREDESVLRLDSEQLAIRIRALPDRDQQTLLAGLTGQTAADAARAAGITVKTWYSRHHAAMRRLVEAFGLVDVPDIDARTDLGTMVERILRSEERPITASQIGHRLGRQSSQMVGVLDRVAQRVPGSARPVCWVAR